MSQKESVSDPMSSVMRIKKRDGRLEDVNVNKIVKAVQRCAEGLLHVDPMRVAIKTISGLYDGATTAELDRLSIKTASELIADEPAYSRLAAKLLSEYIEKEVDRQDIHSFSQSIKAGHESGILSDEILALVSKAPRKLNEAAKKFNYGIYEYFGLRTVYDRYLLRNPETRKVFETPAYFYLRVCCGLATDASEALELFELMSNHLYMPSTPTLFNSGTRRPQMSSCYLLSSPEDSLESIYERYKDIAKLSKYAGGIGVAYSKIRSKDSLIRGTNGQSNGVVPWLKILDSSVGAVNQGGKRKGAAAVYMETWHADIEEFLELKDNTGDSNRRTYNLNTANWIPDLFMQRVEEGGKWSLFDPNECDFSDVYGDAFEFEYQESEKAGLYKKQVDARDLYARMMKTLAETGNGWMCFKDSSNSKSNQCGIVHSSNLCTEIIEVTSPAETAVCNLGSINLGKFVEGWTFNYQNMANAVKTAVKFLDKVIDINFYPIESAERSNKDWRPIGLGVMGLQDVFFKMGVPFDSEEAREMSSTIQKEIYYQALRTSCDLAKEHGKCPNFYHTVTNDGLFQFDLWNVEFEGSPYWAKLAEDIQEHGLRNSLLIAIAPTATIASIVGAYECIEPQISNLFKRETLSGEFVQVNSYLAEDLRSLGLWNDSIKDKIKINNGSIQAIDEIPDKIKAIYRTVWEIPQRSLIDMAADRGLFIDQSQSLNLFVESPTIGKLSSMYMYLWKKGLKTSYYLRSRPATSIAKTTVSKPVEAVTCSLENPGSCESCQ